MDSVVSNHVFGTTYLFNSYDTKKHTTHKIPISDGSHLSMLRSCSANVPKGTLKDVFHIQGMPIKFLSIYSACKKGYKFES